MSCSKQAFCAKLTPSFKHFFHKNVVEHLLCAKGTTETCVDDSISTTEMDGPTRAESPQAEGWLTGAPCGDAGWVSCRRREAGMGPLSWGWLRPPEKPGSSAIATARTLRKRPPARSVPHPSPSPSRIPTGTSPRPHYLRPSLPTPRRPQAPRSTAPACPPSALRSPLSARERRRLAPPLGLDHARAGGGRPAARLRSALRPAVPGARAARVTVRASASAHA